MAADLSRLLSAIGRQKVLAAGDTVFRQGQQAVAIFQVVSGEVHLVRSNSDGKQVVLYRAGRGDYFAEASIDADVYHCSAIRAVDTLLQVLDSRRLLDLLSRRRDFSLHWIKLLSAKLLQQRTTAERLNLKSAAARIEHYLHTEGEPEGEVQLRGSLSQFAEQLGLSRETLYRTLAAMQRQGKIDYDPRVIRLI